MTWDLPRAAVIGGREYALNTDYRDILEIIALLGAPEPDGGAPDKLYIALCLFYDGWLEHGADANAAEAARFMMEFVGCGMPDETGARPVKLIDWRLDEPLIAAGVNAAAGLEVRALPYMHWFTFIGHYMSMGGGMLAAAVGIRGKRARGAKLEPWELEFYREHKRLIDMKPPLTPSERAHKDGLLKLLDQPKGMG